MLIFSALVQPRLWDEPNAFTIAFDIGLETVLILQTMFPLLSYGLVEVVNIGSADASES